MYSLQGDGYMDDLVVELLQKKFNLLMRLENDEVYIRKHEDRLYKLSTGMKYTVTDRAVFDFLHDRSFTPSVENGFKFKGRIW